MSFYLKKLTYFYFFFLKISRVKGPVYTINKTAANAQKSLQCAFSFFIWFSQNATPPFFHFPFIKLEKHNGFYYRGGMCCVRKWCVSQGRSLTSLSLWDLFSLKRIPQMKSPCFCGEFRSLGDFFIYFSQFYHFIFPILSSHFYLLFIVVVFFYIYLFLFYYWALIRFFFIPVSQCKSMRVIEEQHRYLSCVQVTGTTLISHTGAETLHTSLGMGGWQVKRVGTTTVTADSFNVDLELSIKSINQI
jgi:hypothetical protein